MADSINLLWITTGQGQQAGEEDALPVVDFLASQGTHAKVNRITGSQVYSAPRQDLLVYDAILLVDGEPQTETVEVLHTITQQCQGAVRVVAGLAGEDFARANALMDQGAYRCIPLQQTSLLAHAVESAVAAGRKRWREHLSAAGQLEVNSETLFRRAFENSPVGIVIAAADGRAVLANAAFEQMLGYSTDELKQISFLYATHPDDIERHLQLVNEVKAGLSDGFTLEKRYIRKDGSVMWGRLNVFAVKDAGGDILYAVSILMDLTDRKQAEEALRTTQKQLQRVMSVSPVVISSNTINPPHILTYISENVRNVLGYPPEMLASGQGFWLKHIHPDEAQLMNDLWGQIPEEGNNRLEYRLLHGDGTYHWIEVINNLLRDETGAPVEIAGTMIDITERKVAEERLRESEERYRTLAEAAPDMVFVFDRDGIIQYCNSLVLQLLGLQPGEVIGKKYYDLIPVGLKPEQIDLVSRVFSAGEKVYLEDEIHFQTRVMWLGALVVPFTREDDQVTEVLVVSRDITARKEMENKMREAYMREKELNALKSNFVRRASHEFRTPLSAILSSAELLEHYGRGWADEKRLLHFRRIQGAVQELNQRLEEILQVEKTGAGQIICSPKPLELVSYLSELADEARLLDKNLHDLRLKMPAGPVSAVADPNLLRRSVMNLLSNAFKYSDANAWVSLGLTIEGDHFVVEVRDHGIGILPEDVPHLYEDFYRGRNVGDIPGTGMGMIVIRDSVRAMDGKIGFETRVGEGTTFMMRLPLIQKPGPARDAGLSSSKAEA